MAGLLPVDCRPGWLGAILRPRSRQGLARRLLEPDLVLQGVDHAGDFWRVLIGFPADVPADDTDGVDNALVGHGACGSHDRQHAIVLEASRAFGQTRTFGSRQRCKLQAADRSFDILKGIGKFMAIVLL